MATRRDPDGSVLRPPRSLRVLAWAVAGVAALLAVLTALLLLTGAIFPACGFGIAAGVLAVLATPILSGRAEVRHGELITRADPAKTYTLPWREISAVRTRRRLLTEVVAVRRGDVWLELGGPRRWRFRPDAGFTAATGDLARRARVTPERGGRRTPGGKMMVRAVLAVVYVAAFVTLDPVWHSPLWPGRAEASAVPASCPVVAAAARQLDDGRPRLTHRTVRAGDECRYGDTLMLRTSLYTYAVGRDGGIEQARPRFRAAASVPSGHEGSGRPVPGLGDEAAVIVSTGEVKVVARRANAVVQLSYRPRAGKLGGTSVPAATATAERLVRAAVSRITVR